MTDTRTRLTDYLAIAIVCFFAFFVNNNILPADLMESRNLATAEEMVRTGNYLVPTMNGELRLEKPPLPTWIAAGVEHVLPFNLAAQRAVAGLAGTLMVVFLYLLVCRMTRERLLALISAIVLATSFNVIMAGRTATWDIFCHCFMLGGIYCMVCAVERDGRQWLRFSAAGLMMGLSFLSKGPVSFYALLLPFLISYIAVLKPCVKGKGVPIAVMVVVCLVVSAWWPAYIAVFHPETGMMVAAKESGAWLNHNVRPLWYYWGFTAEAGIWALFWVSSLVWFFWKKRPERRAVFRMSVVWTIAALVLLSLIPEKKTRYLLPMLIPGAINIAFYVWQSILSLTGRAERAVFRINGFVIAAIAVATPVAMYLLLTSEGGFRRGAFVLLALIFLVIAAYILSGLIGKKGLAPMKVFMGTVLAMLAFMAFCYGDATRLFVNGDRHSIALLRGNGKVDGMPFYHDSREELRMEFVYEAGRNIRPLDMQDEAQVLEATPFVLVSGQSASEVLDSARFEVEYIGTYDNNWRKPDHKRHNKALVREVAVVRAAEPEVAAE